MDTYIPQFFDVQFGWSMRSRAPREHYHYKHTHGYLLYYVHEGEFDIRVKHQVRNVTAGSILCLPPNTSYELTSLNGHLCTYVAFRILLFGVIDLTHLLSPMKVFRPNPDLWSLLGAFFQEIYQKSSDHKDSSELAVEALTRAVVAYCWDELDMDEVLTVSKWKIPDWLGSLLQQIRHSPDMTVNRLVKKSGFSRSRFRQLFIQYIGQTPQDYLALNRSELAKTMLLKTDMPIGRIAEELGFTSSSDFARFFTHKNGMPPSDFRQSNPPGPESLSLNE